MSNTPPTKRPFASKVVTTAQGVSLNIRSAPNPTASILGKLPRGSQITIYTDGINNGFAQLVNLVAGKIGYPAMEFLADTLPPATPSVPVTPAKRLTANKFVTTAQAVSLNIRTRPNTPPA